MADEAGFDGALTIQVLSKLIAPMADIALSVGPDIGKQFSLIERRIKSGVWLQGAVIDCYVLGMKPGA